MEPTSPLVTGQRLDATRRISVEVSVHLLAQIDEWAKRQGTQRRHVIAHALFNEVARLNDNARIEACMHDLGFKDLIDP